MYCVALCQAKVHGPDFCSLAAKRWKMYEREKVIACLLTYRKMCDKIKRHKLWKVVREHRVEGWLLNAMSVQWN